MTDGRLSEHDARTITRGIVGALRALGVNVEQFTIRLEREGFWFIAVINGRLIWARTGDGRFTYQAVAAELAAAALKAAADPTVHVA